MCKFDLYIASSKSENGSTSIELYHYLEERLRARKDDFDDPSLWKSTLQYSALQLIAKGIFLISVSNVASQSTFSTNGR